MNKRFDYDVIIAGGGPAGSSVAIHLAERGARVLLAEQKKFPRPKLCGEFISPECALHFARLGVADRMIAAGPSPLTETVFYSSNGRKVVVPSDWFSPGATALGLSRAEMDEQLLRRAAGAGVEVLEDTSVARLLFDKARVHGVVLKTSGQEISFRAPLTIDATGRSRVLARMARKTQSTHSTARRARLVAFKAHFEDARVAPGACEIYSYQGGYGGLSTIEKGLSNLCFIVNARAVRARQSDPDRVMRELVCRNQRAAYTLERARLRSTWLAVSLESFGRHSPAPAEGLLAIGDAASFIDPFTGSGMLMALESGELAAGVIGERLETLRSGDELAGLGKDYRRLYEQKFSSRLRICSMLRRAVFVPGLADFTIRFFGASESLRRRITRATRSKRAPFPSLLKKNSKTA